MGKLSAIKEAVEQAAKHLDMSQAARMQRAADQGFDTSKVWHHSTDAEFNEFDFSRLGEFTAKNTDSEWAQNLARLGAWHSERDLSKEVFQEKTLRNYVSGVGTEFNSLDDLEGAIKEAGGPEKLRAQLIGEGKSHVVVNDEEFGAKSLVLLSPSSARSVYAAFDPAQKESSNLLAQIAPAAVGTGLAALGLSPDETQAAINNYMRMTQARNPIMQNLENNLRPTGLNERGVQVSGTMQETPYPVLSQAADVVRTPQAPGIGPLFGGAADYLDKLGQGQEVGYMDRLGAALDVIP